MKELYLRYLIANLMYQNKAPKRRICRYILRGHGISSPWEVARIDELTTPNEFYRTALDWRRFIHDIDV